jgi:hypothetical protein
MAEMPFETASLNCLFYNRWVNPSVNIVFQTIPRSIFSKFVPDLPRNDI